MTQSLAARMNRPRPIAFAVSLLLAWLLLALIAFALRRGPIQDDLSARASAAVRAVGGVHAQVRIEGREAVVTGRFPNAAAAEQARASAAVSGTTSARLGADVVIATEPARPLVLAVTGGVLTVTATVADRESRDALLAAVADAAGKAGKAGKAEVRGRITLDPRVGEPSLGAVPALAAAVQGVSGDHAVTLLGSTVELTGRVADPAAGRRLEATSLDAARASVPGVTVQNHLAIPAAAAKPSTGSPAGGGAVSSGGVGSGGAAGDGATEVLGAVRAALGEGGVTFPVSGATLSPAVRVRLDRVADVLRGGDLTVLVAGHTDATGPSTVNQALSVQRAEAVADYLAGRGVPRERLKAAGFGALEPVGDNGTRAGRAANRRVQIAAAPTS
ncbi:OmpA family protein [Frankia sp. AgPm24]|uniref:OmpA family protein n=1 Tax=Frankia sp. AgPm24 TaxID=631128 RepID=UPI00200EF958|nr:OmpA family protein [Frankia sp. AgPm24]MCK9923798.1 OmpA family protein [Frankia sp. AgPm24]